MHLEVPVQLRWSDLDAYGHVNNVEMLRLLEEARIEAFWAVPELGDGADGGRDSAVLAAGPAAPTAMLVARQEIEYLLPLGYSRAPVLVELWISHLGGASIEVSYRLRESATVYANAITTLVVVDRATGAPQRITAAAKAVWENYVDAPVPMRHRRA